MIRPRKRNGLKFWKTSRPRILANIRCRSQVNRKKNLSLALLIIYCGIIFYFSHQPFDPENKLFQINDKVAHFCEYGLLGFLVANALNQLKKLTWERAWLFTLLFALSDEFHQSFIPGRQ